MFITKCQLSGTEGPTSFAADTSAISSFISGPNSCGTNGGTAREVPRDRLGGPGPVLHGPRGPQDA